MEALLEDPAEEIKRLRRCVNDLVSILALPAIWTGGQPTQIASTLLEALVGMLRLDFAYARLNDPAGPIEMVRVASGRKPKASAAEVGETLRRLGEDPNRWPSVIPNPVGDGEIFILPLRFGLHGEASLIVTGSQRADFPQQTERLLVSVAANQAAIGLQEARLLGEQKRVARELDQRVVQRTQELAAANDELQLQVGLLQRLPVAAWTVGLDGRPDFVNQGWLDYTGQTLDFIQSHPEAWTTAVHPDDREGAARSFWDGVRSGEGFTMEARFRRALDGQYRWHLNRAVALRDADGKILKFIGTSTDIEDLKHSQESLRTAEERTRLIIDTALEAVITIDTRGTVTSWNRQAEVMFGWSNEEAVGRHMANLIIPEQQRPMHERGLHRFLATGEGLLLRRRVEVTAIRRSGAEFPVELQIMPMRLGQDWVFSAFIRDITDSKLAEEKLRNSELHLRRMTETIPEMLWSATPEGVIDYCNTRVLHYSGFAAEEVMGNGWMRLIHPDDVHEAVRVWAHCVATGTPYRVEVRVFHAGDRAYRWCIASALPLLDQQGRMQKWYGTIVDMHDWRQAQEELRNTQAELAHMTRVMTMGELTASIAHEVNQPLSGIITNASTCLRMLAANPPNVDGALETARRTIRDGNRASDVIQRLRALYNRKGATTEAMDLNEATREVIALAQGELQRNGVILRPELAVDLPLIAGDRVQLQQVILNLIRNASDAMSGVEDRSRELLVRTELDGDNHVRLTVKDAGVGIDAQGVARLFQPFYTTKSDGMGIGLSVSRSIIESHHGRIWAVPNQGPGATFSFSIPRDREGAAA